jgi:hypothetical protein
MVTRPMAVLLTKYAVYRISRRSILVAACPKEVGFFLVDEEG